MMARKNGQRNDIPYTSKNKTRSCLTRKLDQVMWFFVACHPRL